MTNKHYEQKSKINKEVSELRELGVQEFEIQYLMDIKQKEEERRRHWQN